MNNRWILPEVQEEVNKLKELEMEIESDKICSIFELSPNYVLLDAALWGTDIDILFLSENAIYRSLFRGSTGKELWSVAPYLVDISSNEELVQKIKEEDPIERRVTWLSSSLDIDGLRKHLRRFLRMKRDDGSYIYFRFYDPFVVNAVFPYLNQNQYSEFFERIDYLLIDDIRINERRLFYLSSSQKLQIKNEPLSYVDNNR